MWWLFDRGEPVLFELPLLLDGGQVQPKLIMFLLFSNERQLGSGGVALEWMCGRFYGISSQKSAEFESVDLFLVLGASHLQCQIHARTHLI